MTSYASPALNRNVIRYWSLTRMLYLPTRSPFSASNRLPGGARRSTRADAAFRRSSFLCTTFQIARGKRRAKRLSTPLNTSSVPVSANVRITASVYRLTVEPPNPAKLPYSIPLSACFTPDPFGRRISRRLYSSPTNERACERWGRCHRLIGSKRARRRLRHRWRSDRPLPLPGPVSGGRGVCAGHAASPPAGRYQRAGHGCL